MKIAVVSSALANKPHNGGNAWAVMNWVLGLKKLGFRVYFFEQIGRAACVDASGTPAPFESSANLAYLRDVVAHFGLSGSVCLIYQGGEQTDGLSYAEAVEVARSADLLINISGHLSLKPLKEGPRRKVYLDLDPGFTQFWHAAGNGGARLEGHDAYFTIGENIGTPGCPIPTGDIRWRPTRQPVVLDACPPNTDPVFSRFTTVASWRGPYGPVEHGGRTYGVKVHQFRKFLALPSLSGLPFEIALDIHPADAPDRDALIGNGWSLVDPRRVAGTPEAFARYVRESGAEFSAAQGVYVETQSGWFSDRTVRYLASGRPALVQDTGFGRNVSIGDGLLAFGNLEEARVGAERICKHYEHHCLSARQLAESAFDFNITMSKFLKNAI